MSEDSLGALEKINNLQKDLKSRHTLKRPQDYIDEVIENFQDEENPMRTGFDCFDTPLRNKLRGKLGLFVGKGGSKKSLLAQQIASTNSGKTFNTVYSTMEMPATQLVERLVDMTFYDDDNNFYGMNASYFFEKESKVNRDQTRDVLFNGLQATFGDRFWINQQSRMRAEDFRTMLERHNNEHDKSDILIVDGLSMMGGSGSETEDYTTNSGELKDLANEFNVFIALICHVTKGCKKHFRNTQDYIRGSEKILDNCDFIMQMSLIQDKDNPDEYVDDLGYIRFYDKRGSGKTVNQVYQFNSQKLKLIETRLDPRDYEIKEKDFKF